MHSFCFLCSVTDNPIWYVLPEQCEGPQEPLYPLHRLGGDASNELYDPVYSTSVDPRDLPPAPSSSSSNSSARRSRFSDAPPDSRHNSSYSDGHESQRYPREMPGGFSSNRFQSSADQSSSVAPRNEDEEDPPEVVREKVRAMSCVFQVHLPIHWVAMQYVSANIINLIRDAQDFRLLSSSCKLIMLADTCAL